jgi:hypothetical protein
MKEDFDAPLEDFLRPRIWALLNNSLFITVILLTGCLSQSPFLSE